MVQSAPKHLQKVENVDTKTASSPYFCIAHQILSMPTLDPCFQSVEGVGSRFRPFFSDRTHWSLAPMALMQKNRVKSVHVGPCGRKTGQKLAKTFRAGFLPYTAKIQNFNLVKGLRFWLQFQKYHKNPNRRGSQNGAKKKWCRGMFL